MGSEAYDKWFDSPTLHIMSQSYECSHGKHYEVVVRVKNCGHEKVFAHTHNYRKHWEQMYQASRELIGVPVG
jgi:hypothetical protein